MTFHGFWKGWYAMQVFHHLYHGWCDVDAAGGEDR